MGGWVGGWVWVWVWVGCGCGWGGPPDGALPGCCRRCHGCTGCLRKAAQQKQRSRNTKGRQAGSSAEAPAGGAAGLEQVVHQGLLCAPCFVFRKRNTGAARRGSRAAVMTTRGWMREPPQLRGYLRRLLFTRSDACQGYRPLSAASPPTMLGPATDLQQRGGGAGCLAGEDACSSAGLPYNARLAGRGAG